MSSSSESMLNPEIQMYQAWLAQVVEDWKTYHALRRPADPLDLEDVFVFQDSALASRESAATTLKALSDILVPLWFHVGSEPIPRYRVWQNEYGTYEATPYSRPLEPCSGLILRALRQLGVSPDHTFVFGDGEFFVAQADLARSLAEEGARVELELNHLN